MHFILKMNLPECIADPDPTRFTKWNSTNSFRISLLVVKFDDLALFFRFHDDYFT